MSDSLQPHRLYSPWNSLGQNTGVGSLSLLQGIFPTQGSNTSLLHCEWILYQLSHKGSPMSRYEALICLLGPVILAAEGQGLLFSLSVPSFWYSDPYKRYFLSVC